jgi:hypothetical protein
MATLRLGWPRLTVWGVVNAVCLLQAVGFATRPLDRGINHALGIVIVALSLPATAALVALVRERAGWRELAGPIAFDLFVAMAIVVDYWLAIEFRDPPLPVILVPYLVLFFGSIVLMGLPMFRIDRRLWTVTAVSALVLVTCMGFAMSQGVG